MIKTFKILSLFLSYPDTELQNFLKEAPRELRGENLLEDRILDRLREFSSHFATLDLIDWQAQYVNLFDTSRSTSLYIFEHLKGDSKGRGQAMADLMSFYQENGLDLSKGELPDYLPAFLEFLSTLDPDKAFELLSQPVNVINRIFSVLKKKSNIYRHVFEAIISLSSEKPEEEDLNPSPDRLMNAGLDVICREPPAESGETFLSD